MNRRVIGGFFVFVVWTAFFRYLVIPAIGRYIFDFTQLVEVSAVVWLASSMALFYLVVRVKVPSKTNLDRNQVHEHIKDLGLKESMGDDPTEETSVPTSDASSIQWQHPKKKTVKVRYTTEVVADIEVENFTIDESTMKFKGFDKPPEEAKKPISEELKKA